MAVAERGGLHTRPREEGAFSFSYRQRGAAFILALERRAVFTLALGREGRLIEDEEVVEEVERVGARLVNGRNHRPPALRQLRPPASARVRAHAVVNLGCGAPADTAQIRDGGAPRHDPRG